VYFLLYKIENKNIIYVLKLTEVRR
jgi:hypothetical protein